MLRKYVSIRVVWSNWTFGFWWWNILDGLTVGISVGPVEVMVGKEI